METLDSLVIDGKEELEERWKDEKYPSDLVHEIADSLVPVYYSDLLEIAQRDIWLATTEPELGPAFDGEATPTNIIAANIYEYLSNELSVYLNELQEADDEEDDE